jgi:omega-hydroxy-beta-dihydromenaquinone-9 sulfotransferase
MPSAPPPERPTWFATRPPLVKLAIGFGVVAGLALLIEAVCLALGLDWSVFSEGDGGRGVLLGLALGTLMALMAADRRPLADYGLSVGPGWAKALLGGFAAGAAVYGGYCLLALSQGALTLQAASITPYRLASTGLSALAAFPVALVQQILFTGYLLSVLRDRYGRITAVLGSALLFALLYRIESVAAALAWQPQPLVVGMFLIAVLLGVLRLKTGGILVPAGFLAGCIFVRRVMRGTALLAEVGNSDAAVWWAPSGDPRQAPVLWLALVLGIVACWIWLLHRGESRSAATGPALDAKFKRTFPLSHGSMLAPLDVWLGRLIAARFRVGWKYLPRLAAVLVVSAINTVVTLPERLLLPLLLRRRRVADPVFILGVHRSGTTHLHNMLALDPQFTSARAYHIMNPAGFTASGWLLLPCFAAFLPWKRPMDSVRFHIFTPQEEEFALAGLCRVSPYWGLTFPRQGAAYDRFIFPGQFTERELRLWRREYVSLLRRLTLFGGKRPLLKNPYNTARVAALADLFPRARFIHIYRHPHAVYRSNMHTAREGHVVNQLQDPDPAENYQTRFLDNYRTMEEAFYRQSEALPDGQVAEVRFEDLERDPVGEVRRLYARLGLDFSPEFARRLDRYLAGVAGYRKNRFKPLSDDEQRAIAAKMGPFMQRWGYNNDPAAQPSDAAKAA